MVDIESLPCVLPVLDVFTGETKPLPCYQEGHRFYVDGSEICEVNVGDESAFVRRNILRKDPGLNLYFAFWDGKLRGVSSYRSIIGLIEDYGFPSHALLSALSSRGKQQTDEERRTAIIAERELRETTFGQRYNDKGLR